MTITEISDYDKALIEKDLPAYHFWPRSRWVVFYGFLCVICEKKKCCFEASDYRLSRYSRPPALEVGAAILTVNRKYQGYSLLRWAYPYVTALGLISLADMQCDHTL